MKIAICSSEVVPFAKTGGLADVAGALPLALERLKQEVIILMPFYKKAALSKIDAKVVHPGILSSTVGQGIKVYFIQNDKYFNREGLYGTQQGDYPDNLERFSFFCEKSLEFLKQINFSPDIIHAHDWQASYIPIFLKTKLSQDPFFKNCKTLITIHNLAYQGTFTREEFPKLGLDWSFFNMEQLEFYGKGNTLKGGIVFSDCINTVSKTYAKEIQSKDFGCGLEGVLSRRRDCLFGILNGLDYSIWNPATDEFIAQRFDIKNLKDKYKNKQDLQRYANLPVTEKVPLLGMVSRLAEQKGLDILAGAIDQICKLKLQLVILGTGDIKYHKLLESKSKEFPKVLRLYLKFDNSLAHKIYAGSDIFLMPSKYEPCGLGQMISLKYGTLPLVYKTGGLADTINETNGFVFDDYTTSGLVDTAKKSISLYQDKRKWQEKIKQGMRSNFSWDESAKQYIKLYQKLAKK
ncbi:MAG: glycogen synthase GlgA [Candidatus Omnitrophota bacterium]|jgi:starch synthase